ncbi:MAG: hypothetical protein ACTHJ0_10535 [Flavipsychrobacter sp.]
MIRLPKSIKFLLFSMACFSTISSFAKGPVRIISGLYNDGLALSYDSSDNLITGYIYVKAEPPANYGSCDLFFKAKFSGSDKMDISIYQPGSNFEVSEGTLELKGKSEVIIQTKNMLMPCQAQIDLKGGESFEFSQRKSFLRISIIKVDKQHLYDQANESTPSKAYLVKYDPVEVISEKGDWVLIKYLKNEKIEKWLPKASIL